MEGTGKESEGQARKGFHSQSCSTPVQTVHPTNGGGGSPRTPCSRDGRSRGAGPPGRVSASSEQESERLLLIKTLRFQTVVMVEILLKGFLTSGSQVIVGTGMDEVRSSYRRGEAPCCQEFPFVWSGV